MTAQNRWVVIRTTRLDDEIDEREVFIFEDDPVGDRATCWALDQPQEDRVSYYILQASPHVRTEVAS